jgi:hypothetical protein
VSKGCVSHTDDGSKEPKHLIIWSITMFSKIKDYFLTDRKTTDEARELLNAWREDQQAADELVAKLEAKALVMKLERLARERHA